MRTRQEIAYTYLQAVKAHGGRLVGANTFCDESHIAMHYFCGVYWPSWSAFQSSLGFEPNKKCARHSDEFMLRSLAELALKLKRIPSWQDIRQHRKQNPAFPSPNSFQRLGLYREVVEKLGVFCHGREGIAQVAKMVEFNPAMSRMRPHRWSRMRGFVYLTRQGDNYRLGCERAFGAPLHRAVTIKSYAPDTVHIIDTDDPEGAERYWRRRFRSKRVGRKLFRLAHEDVTAFRWRKFQ